MRKRTLCAALVCALALIGYRILGPIEWQDLKTDEKIESERANCGHSHHTAFYLEPNLLVEPTRLGRDQFLAPAELFAPGFEHFHTGLAFGTSKAGSTTIDHLFVDFRQSLLLKLLLGSPEVLPVVSVRKAHLTERCDIGPYLLSRSHWKKQLACQADEIKLTFFHLTTFDFNSTTAVSFQGKLFPLPTSETDQQLERLLASKQMSREDLGPATMEQFGYFVEASLELNNPNKLNQTVRMVCAGELFMAVNTGGRVYEAGSRGFFNLKQYGNVSIPDFLNELDFYLAQGIENRGLLVSQPEFKCELLGDNFLLWSLRANMALVLKPTFPFISLNQRFVNLKGILTQLDTNIQQIAGPKHSEQHEQFKTIVRVVYTNELANFSSAIYTKVLNSPASSGASFFEPEDSREDSSDSATPSAAQTNYTSKGPFSDPNQCAVPQEVDGASILLLNGLFGLNLALNFSQAWSETIRQHSYELSLTAGRKFERARRRNASTARRQADSNSHEDDMPKEQPGQVPKIRTDLSKRPEGSQGPIANLMLTDYRKADLIILSFDVRRNWRLYVREAFDLNREVGWRRLFARVKLDKPTRSSDQMQQVLMVKALNILTERFELQERLERCSSEPLLPATLKKQISCLPDGEDNDLYVRQLKLSSHSNNLELFCYPLQQGIILNRIKSALNRLHQINALISDQKLEGFVRDHLKLGFFCAGRSLNFSVFGKTLWLQMNTVLIINETKSNFDWDTDGDDHDTLIDQWNWLLQSVLLGNSNKGLLLDNRLELSTSPIGETWWREPDHLMRLDQSLLVQDFFPYVTHSLKPLRVSDPEMVLVGSINQTCHDKPKQTREYNFLDLRTGINAVILSDEQEANQLYDLDAFTKTTCSLYNTSYRFFGHYESNKFLYERTIQVNASNPNATTSDEFSGIWLPEQMLTMLGSGRDEANKGHTLSASWMKQNGTISIALDMTQTAKAGDPIMETHLVIKKDLLFELKKALQEINSAASSRLRPIRTVELRNLGQLFTS